MVPISNSARRKWPAGRGCNVHSSATVRRSENVSSKPRKPPTGKPPGEKVVPLRKSGPLAPVRKRGLSISFGIEDDDLVTRDAEGKIERHKLTGEDDD